MKTLGHPLWQDEIHLLISGPLDVTFVQLDAGVTQQAGEVRVREALAAASTDKVIILIGTCPEADYAKRKSWNELIALQNVHFVRRTGLIEDFVNAVLSLVE